MKRGIQRGRILESKALRNKKRRKVLMWSVTALSIPILLLCGISYLSYIDIFQIRSITVEGTNVLKASVISAMAGSSLAEPFGLVFSRDTALTYPHTEIVDEIKNIGLRVKDVHVSVSGLNTLSVKVTERTPVAEWCQADLCHLVDTTGLAYDVGTSSDAHITFISATTSPLIGTSSEITDETSFTDFMKFIASLADFGWTPAQALLSTEGDVTISMASSSGPQLIIAFGEDTEKIYTRLSALVNDATFKAKIDSHTLNYIDLRFGNKIYYKPEARGTAKATSTKASTTKR